MSSSTKQARLFVPLGHCVQCNAVKRKLDAAKVEYDIRPLFDEDVNVTDEAKPFYDEAKARGFSSTPLVVGTDGDEVFELFAGNNPTQIKRLISCVTIAH